MTHKPKILFYDIETKPLQAWIWRTGEQRILSTQLVNKHNQYDIICLAYSWLDSNKVYSLNWGYKNQNSKSMIQKFTKICREADIIIGKNNNRFDDKFINTLRLRHGLEGAPDLLEKVDDLEKQIRKYFYLPSFKLDYISEIFGYGGKEKVGFDDWINIVEKNPTKGLQAFKRMIQYNIKDVKDTKKIWKKCSKYFKPKFNLSVHMQKEVCTHCGSTDIKRNGTTQIGLTKYQNYYCNNHGGFAGKKPLFTKKLILKS